MNNQLLVSLLRLAQIQMQPVDRLGLQAAVNDLDGATLSPEATVLTLMKTMSLPRPKLIAGAQFDPTQLPALLFSPDKGWGVLKGQNALGKWISEWFDGENNQWHELALDHLNACQLAKLALVKPFDASRSPVFRLIKDTVLQHKSSLVEIVLGGVMINLIALATSIYSMQVYDRVVPTGATQTLLALTLGVLGVIFFEFVIKLVRSNLNQRMADFIDTYLARTIYTRLLSVRMDQMPSSVGGLAAQLKSYETVRSFLSTLPTQVLVDIPFFILYTLVILAIAGWLAGIALVFAIASLVLGLAYRKRVEALSQSVNQAVNLKMGLLVETIEGAETIKSGQGGWRMLMRWLQTADDARTAEFDMRNVSEHSQYWVALLHQISYVCMVAAGAMMVSRGELTMGALIACTILSGRVLAPIGTIPAILVQWGHCKAALQGLDRVWSLQDDHFGVDHPVALERVQGLYEFDQVEFAYGANKAFQVANLQIRPGEKIGVLGPIGSGKTTLLRLLSGMYKPQKGTIKLDHVDLSHIGKPILAEQVGYLQQDGRLFAGTLRDNLILGLVDPGDQAILDAAALTGLQEAVLAQHPLGLQQPITEGGIGLSGGQKQLANLTRVFLRQPRIWLLDEPTASLDRNSEVAVIKALATKLRPEDTLVLVTHKSEMLNLVDRLIVVVNHQVIMDGPKAEVIQKLQNQPAAAS
ncbi:ATP-binding cassette domain-containing protein [Dechloromonas sp. HYN0024]|uniref:ATP-binding cassette domain-containing protein n=1 Tax=Dechloromonas sp. HYN0024 TaxID=2231055 RepID=UPI000E435135|nr:ATP-binding cassette domain-containing protein [Dechloromonas sp. HYN0024]AXS80352.1 ATP-binding cassette domain-containing protein [Dechloromonas sp. HYN0024]